MNYRVRTSTELLDAIDKYADDIDTDPSYRTFIDHVFREMFHGVGRSGSKLLVEKEGGGNSPTFWTLPELEKYWDREKQYGDWLEDWDTFDDWLDDSIPEFYDYCYGYEDAYYQAIAKYLLNFIEKM